MKPRLEIRSHWLRFFSKIARTGWTAPLLGLRPNIWNSYSGKAGVANKKASLQASCRWQLKKKKKGEEKKKICSYLWVTADACVLLICKKWYFVLRGKWRQVTFLQRVIRLSCCLYAAAFSLLWAVNQLEEKKWNQMNFPKLLKHKPKWVTLFLHNKSELGTKNGSRWWFGSASRLN